MALSDLTDPDAVLRALAEFDRVGRDRFLKEHGFRKSRSYFLTAGEATYLATIAHLAFWTLGAVTED
jgi:hypothetical protein